MGNVSDKDSAWAEMSSLVGLPMAARAVVLLNVPKIIDAAHPVLALSTEEICKHVPPDGEHPASPQNLERILDFLCSNGIFSKTVEEGEGDFKLKKYAHSPKSRCLSDDHLAETLLMFTSPELTKVWPHANKLVFNPDVPVVEVITGKGMYQYFADDAPDVHRMYVRALNRTAPQALKLLENYDEHFKALKGRVVDVAGQVGTLCAELASKYPHLQFVNFDLPEVVKEAPPIPGVEHVGGNFFDSVPQGNLLHLKFCLINWDDERCIKILTNCRKALPAAQGGKLLIVDPLDRFTEASDPHSGSSMLYSAWFNFVVPMLLSGARKRTVEQIRKLALAAGFAKLELVAPCPGYDLMEASIPPNVNAN